ncbi:hypothetical protein GGQ68_003972 [Sagittula marina]|uniref:Uncharacterized protein n=1 Tax=Sagittula marina TaxID=943940 RepID=A0A7W6DR10_9RHOB|nr:hypothetical protein [Sagittula marina]MBB3987625.1 hypothetical protein [Sagittula marina]
MDEILEWLAPLTPILALSSLMIAILSLTWNIRSKVIGERRTELKERIASPAYRHAEIAAHICTRSERYRNGQRRLLGWLARRVGGIWSAKSFATCMTLAYLYPIAGAFLGWIISGQTTLGGLELFRDVESFTGRLSRAALVLAAMAFFAWFWPFSIKTSEHWGLLAEQRLDRLPHRTGFLSKAVRWGIGLSGAVAVVVAVVGAVVGAVVVVGAGFGFSAVVVAVVVAFAGAGFSAVVGAGAGFSAVAFAGAVAVVVVVVGVGFGFGAVDGDLQQAALIPFVWLLLPLLNAFADYLSFNVTRGFLTAASRQVRSAWWLVSRVVLDLIFGLICLALLLFTLRYSLDLWANLSPETLPLDWRAYWADARQDWSQGMALWIMCATTLVPTFVHVIWGFVHWQTAASQHTQDAVALMAAQPTEAHITDNAVLSHIARDLRRGQINAALRVTAGVTAFVFVSAALLLSAQRIFG